MQPSELHPGQELRQLPDRIIHILHASPLQKAGEIAHWIGIDPSLVLKVLTELQGITVQQDSQYRWSLMTSEESAAAARKGAVQPRTEVSRLCQYFLDCLGQDNDVGVSIPCKDRDGRTNYAELGQHPHMGQSSWWDAGAARAVLSGVRADRNLEAWVGYPVRVSEGRGANGGLCAEPLLLWKVIFPSEGQGYRLEEGMPQVNFQFLRNFCLGAASAVVEEAAALGTELGLNNLPKDQPGTEELLLRMYSLRPEWDWVEPVEPRSCSTGLSLSELTEVGIYNRAILVPAKRSPYTQGLETELKTLSQTPAIDFLGTALDQWFNGQFLQPYVDDSETQAPPLIEVLPMNSEQRASVQSALIAPLTVVTGPPGTGKSQVVTNLLVNAAWRGMRVLFASKNNKAVDVVEARINNLGNRPVLLRLGSSEYQNKLAGYFSSMLRGQVGPEDLKNYQEKLARHTNLLDQAQLLDELTLKTMETRNYVDQLDSEVAGYRCLFRQGAFLSVSEGLLEGTRDSLYRFIQALEKVNPAHASLFDRLFGFFFRESQLAQLLETIQELIPLATDLGVDEPDLQRASFEELDAFVLAISERLTAGESVVSYRLALESLLMSPPLETIAQHRLNVTDQVARNSAGLWKDWVQLVPSRLSPAERSDVAEYASLLQVLSDPGAKNANSLARRRAFELQQKVTSLFTCWAVTSLSVRGKVPLDPGYFDLVVIDEAGQCDIASAIPLLYRARRAVIIGDPMQLKHISGLARGKDLEFQARHGLSQNRASWLYSVNSLYDLAAGVATPGSIINLRDHHRSHADIIGFSNKVFYGGRLRIATKYDALTQPENASHGIAWTEVKGECGRPAEGGLRNLLEAQKVVEVIKDLLLTQKFKGTVGVVTPFRAQASLIQAILSRHSELNPYAQNAELLVDTAHRFQGDERDVIIFSPVVSDIVPNSALSFLQNNGNLFNVAITRARALLHVVGDSQAMRSSHVEYFSLFAQYSDELFATKPIVHTPQEDLGPEYPEVSKPGSVSEWERTLYQGLYAVGIQAIPQHTVEQFDIDLAIVQGSRKLAIEIDGENYHHGWTGEDCLRDQLRSQRLIELGWDVKRFWVYEIRDKLSDCVEQVFAWTKAQR